MAVPGSVVGVGKLITPGGQQGVKGDAGTAANVPLADITQNGLMRKTSGLTTDFFDGTNNCQAIQPVIWSTRLRSYNSVMNPNFEVDQRTVGTGLTGLTTGVCMDRWYKGGSATLSFTANQATYGSSPPVNVVQSFAISSKYLRATLTVQKSSLASTDALNIYQIVEGPSLRELISDVHSVSLLVRSSVASLNFGMFLRDSVNAYTLCKLCTTSSTTQQWTLIQLPNLPVWPPAGTFPITPGSLGYSIGVSLAIGANNITSANDTWQSGAATGAIGMSNFAASPVNSTFDIAFVQHEPGPLCTTFQDKPFIQNYDETLRFYTKSYLYGVAPGTANSQNSLISSVFFGSSIPYLFIPFKKTMAKQPTVIGYAYDGTINSVRDVTAGVNKVITGPVFPGDHGFSGFNVTSPNASNWQTQFHYTADTGW